MKEEFLTQIRDSLAALNFDVSRLNKRMDALENELRLMDHSHTPQLKEMRQEIVDLKKFADQLTEGMEGGKPVEATQPPPRR